MTFLIIISTRTLSYIDEGDDDDDDNEDDDSDNESG